VRSVETDSKPDVPTSRAPAGHVMIVGVTHLASKQDVRRSTASIDPASFPEVFFVLPRAIDAW